MWQVQAWTYGRLDEQSTWTLEDGKWTIECQAGQWFHRVWDIFRRVSLKAEWFRRTELWQRLCCLLWNQEQGNIAHQQISDNAVGPWRFQSWEYSVIHRDLRWNRRLWRKQYHVQGGSNIAFGVNSDVWMISLISKERRNTSSCAQSIIVGKLCER